MGKALQVLKAYSVAEIRSTPHVAARDVEYILWPSRDRYLWNPASAEDDDGHNFLALADAGGCSCCGGRGRFERWQIAADSGSSGGGGVTDHGALTGLEDDDHPQYTMAAEATSIAQTEATAAVAAHEAALDPHPQYTTVVEASILDAAAIAAHVAAADPHTAYIRADGTRAFTGDQSMGGQKLTDLGAPVAGSDAARLADVDDRRTDWGDIILLTD
jgi:hypothetical protein